MECFNLKIVHDNFEESLYEDDDVQLQFYLNSYYELDKFFSLMGTIFSFVSTDLRAKVDTLQDFLKSTETAVEFNTVKQMILYEKEQKLLHKPGYVSGSRTLLRLHRGLDFIKLFLKKLGDLKDEDNTSASCREAYEQTLAHHHTFFIRNGAKLAMYTMPTREQLLKRVCKDGDNIQTALDHLPKALEVTGEVYDRIEKLYTEFDLHGLP